MNRPQQYQNPQQSYPSQTLQQSSLVQQVQRPYLYQQPQQLQPSFVGQQLQQSSVGQQLQQPYQAQPLQQSSLDQQPQQHAQTEFYQGNPMIDYLLKTISELKQIISRQDETITQIISRQDETITKLTCRVSKHDEDIAKNQEDIAGLKRADILSGTQREADIVAKQKTLQYRHQDIYQKELYQNLISFIDAHMLDSTHLLVRAKSGNTTGEQILETISSILKLVTHETHIPGAHLLAKAFNWLVHKKIDEKHKKISEEETNAVCSFISQSPEDIKISCFGASVQLASRNHQEIWEAICGDELGFFHENENGLRKTIRKEIQKKFKSSIQRYSNLEDSRACNLAIEDTMIVIVEIYLRYHSKTGLPQGNMEHQLISMIQEHY